MKISINPINQKNYQLPKNFDDSAGINNFLSKHSNKKVIAVQGLGFVGSVMSLVCANSISEEYAVIGIDLPDEKNFWKIASLNEGIFPLIADDPMIDEFFQESKIKKNFYATYDPLAYSFADVIVVDINLDVQKVSSKDNSLKEFDVNLEGFKKAISTIGEHCNENALILVETTVPPGTCSNLIKPTLDEKFNERGISKDKYFLGHSYERVMPGPDYVNSIRCYPRVYSGIDQKSADSVESFLKTIIDTNNCELTRLHHTNATEIAKVLENSYRATNIAFVVEWSRFAEEAGVDLYSIVNAIRVRETHSNLMYPGIGVGGYCLTKDPLLASWSRKHFFNSKVGLNMSTNSVSTNDQMPIFAFNRLIEVFGNVEDKKLLFLGVSYRGDVGDTRFSPVETFFSLAKKSGAIVSLHDPFVSFWEEHNCVVNNSLKDTLDSDPDIIVITTGHSFYKNKTTISSLMNIKSTKIFDTLGVFDKNQIKEIKTKHTLSILGRGDIN